MGAQRRRAMSQICARRPVRSRALPIARRGARRDPSGLRLLREGKAGAKPFHVQLGYQNAYVGRKEK
eukprot:10677180-Lingulodinium_polyedra.AAC.1